MKKRIYAGLAVLAAAAVCAAAAYGMEINPPAANVVASFAVIIAAMIAFRLVKVPDGLYYTVLLFIFFASPVGSVLNLYRLWGPYDKIVHFCSGLLLAACGYALAVWLFEKIGVSLKAVMLPVVLITFLTASAGAGIWEIIEFITDRLAGGGMQRGMVDTVTDMIAGNLGGLLYSGLLYGRMIKD